MEGDLDSGLLAIALSDSEDSSSPKETLSQLEKTAQSEADFQAVRASYQPKIENGEASKNLLSPPAGFDELWFSFLTRHK